MLGVIKTCRMTDEDDDEGDELQRGTGLLLTKSQIYRLFTTSHCAK